MGLSSDVRRRVPKKNWNPGKHRACHELQSQARITIGKGHRTTPTNQTRRTNEVRDIRSNELLGRKSELENLGARFIDELKNVRTQLKKKSRMAARDYADEGAYTIASKDLTVQIISQ